MALTILEQETCSGCGTPAWIGHSTNSEIVFKADSSVCYGCAELEKDREERERNQQKQGRGETRYVTPHHVWEEDGERLPSRYDSYLEMLEE